MNALENIIRMRIEQNGPMPISEFMALALSHPEHGYYVTRDPFGRSGDFTTSPEISQMFGEMIGAWIADAWVKADAPERFILLECGPGRGTLMADILRVTKAVQGFHGALEIHLMEMSATLKEAQKETLSGYMVQWHETLETVPQDAPIFIFGNEFFDALPVQHLLFQDGKWHERKIGFANERFTFVAAETQNTVPDNSPAPKDGDIYEYSPASESLMALMSERVKEQGGALLFIDYGYESSKYGETLQAVKAHQYAPVLEAIGESDLTAHVDFGTLHRIAKAQGLKVFDVVDQGYFLQVLGIDTRAQTLMKSANEVQQKNIEGALTRFIDPQHMGALFKVVAATSYDIELAGFKVGEA